jgi:hypothetical protein
LRFYNLFNATERASFTTFFVFHDLSIFTKKIEAIERTF